jgi:hypothetical protein
MEEHLKECTFCSYGYFVPGSTSSRPPVQELLPMDRSPTISWHPSRVAAYPGPALIGTLLTLAACFPLNLSAFAADPVQDKGDLAKRALSENTRTLKSLFPLRYHVDSTYEYLAPKGPATLVSADIVRNGANMVGAVLTEGETARSIDRQPNHRFLITDRFTIVYSVDLPIRKWNYESFDSRPDAARLNVHSELGGSDWLLNGPFGIDSKPLEQVMAIQKENHEWEAIEKVEDGEKVVLVRRFTVRKDKTRELFAELTMAPEKGFIVTHRATYSGGQPFDEATVKLVLLPDKKTWFPESIDCTNYRSNHLAVSTTHSVFKNVELHPALDKDQFTLTAIHLSEGAAVSEISPAGKVEEKKWINKEFVPLSPSNASMMP